MDEVLYQVNKQYMAAAEDIDKPVDANFSESANDLWEANNNGADLLKSAMCFPIGFTMTAEHVRSDGSHFGKDELPYWQESVTLLVDMDPDYLLAESDGDKKLINLGVQNICLFGPTQLVPILVSQTDTINIIKL